MIANSGSGAPTAAMRKQCNVSAGLEIFDFSVRGEEAEFHEMISAATGAKLRPRTIFVLPGHGTDRPIGIHDFVLAALFETGSDTKARLRFDGAREPVLVPLQVLDWNIQHRHFH